MWIDQTKSVVFSMTWRCEAGSIAFDRGLGYPILMTTWFWNGLALTLMRTIGFDFIGVDALISIPFHG
jgi:hypothetical protein